jgi:MoaA/NifB/PqqE/SkfB family radical SAM enzyme
MESSIHDYDRLEHLEAEHYNWFVVNWCLGNTCNFACSYCPESLHDGSKRWHDTENVKNFVAKIKNYHPSKKIYFEFTGGEVTLNKDFINICKFCTENGVKVGFISNGSRTVRWWEENKPYFDAVMLSYHSEFADPDHFVKLAEILNDEVRTHVNIMMKPDNWVKCLEVAEKIRRIGNVSLALQPLMHDLSGDLYPYDAGQLYIFSRQYRLLSSKIQHRKSFGVYRGAMKTTDSQGKQLGVRTAHSFISRNTHSWLGWECFAGVEQCIVDMDGSVWRGWCRVGGKIGSIDDTNLVLPTTGVICNKDKCTCNYDIMSTKVRQPGGV